MTDLITLSVGTAGIGAVFVHASESWLSDEASQYAARAVGIVFWVLSMCCVALAIWKAATA